MATTFSVTGIKAGFAWGAAKTTNVGADTSNSGSFVYSNSLTAGTGAEKVNMFYVDEIPIAAGATVNLDVSGALTDVFAASVTFTKIRLLYVELLSTETSTGESISVGGHASAACASFFGDVSDKIKVRLGGCLQLTCKDATAYAVTATTGDMLKITNNDAVNPVIVRIGLAGE